MERIEASWIAEGRTRVFGIPLFFGTDEAGRPFLQRLAFTSVFSEKVHAFVRDPRFAPILELIGEGARVGDREKDGVVFNRYLNVPGSVYPRLGWHTDGLRDLFYGRMPQEMLNVGLHLDRCTRDNGGLRLIPGQPPAGLLVDVLPQAVLRLARGGSGGGVRRDRAGRPDGPRRPALAPRGALAARPAAASLRRSMYLPYLTGPYEPKSDDSPTPAYHRLGRVAARPRRTADAGRGPSRKDVRMEVRGARP